MSVGIDKIGFYTPKFYIDMVDLAHARNEDPNKYLVGIGQTRQAVAPVTQDIVTMAANAAATFLTAEDKQNIEMIIFGTESGIDNSKAAAMYLQNLLELSHEARAFEIKQACYGATAGLQMAVYFVKLHPEASVLVVGADIARYGINTPGEVTQGAGAVAMLVKSNPDLVEIEEPSTFYSEDIMDFWRPLYRSEAIVDGHYSNNMYIDFFTKTWEQYQQKTNQTMNDFDAFLFHLPYTKMGIKALRTILTDDDHSQKIWQEFEAAKKYNAEVGNIYTGSLYLSLLSWLANSTNVKQGNHIGLFSFGSGAQGEFFAGRIGPAKKRLEIKDQVDEMLADRTLLSIDEYEEIFNARKPFESADYQLDTSSENANYYLLGQKNHQLIYKNANEK